MARRFSLRVIAFAAALVAGPAAAADLTPAQLSAWVSANTDISPAQIAFATPEHVYGLEPLGPRSATDEVVALARTEAFDGDWGARRGVQSWEAHLLFDCRGKRVRMIRSADYRQRNRQGAPVATGEPGNWLTPSADQPAGRLLAAACDPAFAWPFRTQAAAAPPPTVLAKADPIPPAAPALPVIERVVKGAPPVEAAKPVALPPPAAAPATFTIQIARGPSAEGARKALKDARKTLGRASAGLAADTELSKVGSRNRYTAVLGGFASADAAAEACDKLHAAEQRCFVRAARGEAADDEPAEAPPAPKTVAAAPAAAPPEGYVIQLAYGPSEEGATRAIQKARKALGREANGLKPATETSQIGERMRYTALLGGFETAAEALHACDTLQKAQLTCFARPAQAPPAG